MKREELIKVICAEVLKESNISKSDMENSNKCGSKTNYVCGLYFLYNDFDEIIYIGMVGNGPNTSLYHRMKGHGSGSHAVKDSRWYSYVKYGKFHQFKGMTDRELEQIERLAIAGMNQPVYNDKVDIIQKIVDIIASKI